MNEMRRGLPLTRARVEQIFPKLTQSQIDRFAALGHIRTIDDGEVLYEQGQSGAPLFVVVSGELKLFVLCYQLKLLLQSLKLGSSMF